MKIFLSLALTLFSTAAFSQPVNKSFDELWKELFHKSFHQEAIGQEKVASELSLERAKRHWLPRAYVTGQWFSTNDPTQVFFNHLGQRSIEQADFIPSDLNRPGRKNFSAASLGLDLPLYEGGMKLSQTSMFESLVKASAMEMKAKKTEEYAELGRQFGMALLYTQNAVLLNNLKKKLEGIIANYQVGSQSNPVGYSGLLGLKGVSNRIEGMLSEYELKSMNAKKWIAKKTETDENWTPDIKENLNDFLSSNFTHTSSSAYSSLILAQKFKVETLDDQKEMEKARFLPRVGLFAQNSLYDGDRDSANAQTYGVYFMWDLFNSDSYGRLGEANAKAMAGKAKLEAYKQDEKIMLDQLLDSKVTLQKNLVLLRDSDRLLEEQTQNATKLFRSGMLSALQLSEVINRRVDLIENKNKAENQYLEVYSRIYQINN